MNVDGFAAERLATDAQVKPSLTFLYPSRVIGGAQLLFARLAQAIAASGAAEVAVVDYPDGFMWRYLKDQGAVRCIEYVEGRTALRDTTIIVPLSHLVELRYMLDRASLNCNFLFWSIHPDNVQHVLYSYGRGWFGKRPAARSGLRDLAEAGHVVFMDGANKHACEAELGRLARPSYLQIPIELAGVEAASRRRPGATLTVAWLGRITYDKIHSLRKIVDDVAAFGGQGQLALHVIGAGSEERALEAHARQAGVALVRPGVLQGPQLRDYLLRHVDLGVAMGTSALEIAALAIPVALVDYALTPLVPASNYDWLYDTTEYSLGNNAAWGLVRARTLADLVRDVRADHANAIGMRCREYVAHSHDLARVAARLVDHASGQAPIDTARLTALERRFNPPLHSAAYRALRSARRAMRAGLRLGRA